MNNYSRARWAAGTTALCLSRRAATIAALQTTDERRRHEGRTRNRDRGATKDGALVRVESTNQLGHARAEGRDGLCLACAAGPRHDRLYKAREVLLSILAEPQTRLILRALKAEDPRRARRQNAGFVTAVFHAAALHAVEERLHVLVPEALAPCCCKGAVLQHDRTGEAEIPGVREDAEAIHRFGKCEPVCLFADGQLLACA
jgi:hypothetical protein